MKVLNVAYPFAPVRHDTAGGSEQVVAMLDRALSCSGHQSLVIASLGSLVAGELIATPDHSGLLTPETQLQTRQLYRNLIVLVIERCKPDLIHFHGIDFNEYLPPPGIPVVATLHLPTAWYNPAVFSLTRPQTYLHCVSRSQQESCPKIRNLLPFIANGVSENLPRPHVCRRDFAFALGRICPEKGFHLAFAAARNAEIPLLLAGKVYGYDSHRQYFDQEIAPACDRQRRFIGTIGITQKRRLFSAARCLLMPSLAPETSSLVAMEAAMCGTPVIAFRSGALPEIVQEGQTGFLVDDVPGMAQAIGKCNQIDRTECRKFALQNFSEQRASSEYLSMYQRLIQSW